MEIMEITFYFLFNEALSSSDFVQSNCKMIRAREMYVWSITTFYWFEYNHTKSRAGY
jgi:hypothetical protein